MTPTCQYGTPKQHALIMQLDRRDRQFHAEPSLIVDTMRRLGIEAKELPGHYWEVSMANTSRLLTDLLN